MRNEDNVICVIGFVHMCILLKIYINIQPHIYSAECTCTANDLRIYIILSINARSDTEVWIWPWTTIASCQLGSLLQLGCRFMIPSPLVFPIAPEMMVDASQ